MPTVRFAGKAGARHDVASSFSRLSYTTAGVGDALCAMRCGNCRMQTSRARPFKARKAARRPSRRALDVATCAFRRVLAALGLLAAAALAFPCAFAWARGGMATTTGRWARSYVGIGCKSLNTKLLKRNGIQWWESMGFNGIRWDSMGFMTSAQKLDLQAACANFIGPAKGILIIYARDANQTQTLTAGGKCPLYIILGRHEVVRGTPAALALVF